MALLLSAATGMQFSAEELITIGSRIVHLERAYWNRLLVGRLEDKSPKRFTEEPMPDGPNKGTVFPEAELIPPLLTRYGAGTKKQDFRFLRFWRAAAWEMWR
jgi:aldehyde:ferredoxin oxidoreductase